MAKTVNVDLNVQSNISGSIKELKELKKELRNTAVGSEEFKQIFNQIDDLEDKIKSAKNTSSDWVDSLEMAGGPLGMLGGAINRAKVATQSFSSALKASGIGLLVGVIGGLVAAFNNSEKAGKKLQPILIGMQRILNGVYSAVEPLFDIFISLAEKALPYLESAFKGVYSALAATAESIQLFFSGDFKKAFTEFGNNFDEAGKRFKAGTKEITKIEKEALGQKKELTEQQKAMIRSLETYYKNIEEERKDNEEEALKQKEARIQREIDMLNSIRQYEANIEAERRDLIAERKLNDFNRLQQEAETLEASNALRDNDFEQDIIRNEQRILNLTEQREIELASFDLTEQKKYEITKKYGDQIVAIDKQNTEIAKAQNAAKINAVAAYGNALGQVASIIGEQTEAGKGLAAASALINTYAAIAGQLAAFAGVPIPGYAIAQAIATGVVGFAQVAKIFAVNTQNPNADTSAPSISSTSSVSNAPRFNLITPIIQTESQKFDFVTPTAQSAPPNFNVVGNSAASQTAQVLSQNASQPVKAYVVANDVTTAQSLNRNIVKSATLG